MGAEDRINGTRKEDAMATPGFAVDARCPLCGSLVLTVDRGGRVLTEYFHTVRLDRNRKTAEGYTLCDSCGVLANLPENLTLN